MTDLRQSCPMCGAALDRVDLHADWHASNGEELLPELAELAFWRRFYDAEREARAALLPELGRPLTAQEQVYVATMVAPL